MRAVAQVQTRREVVDDVLDRSLGVRELSGDLGRVPLGDRRFSLADAPDLKVLPALWPGLPASWMGAGTVPEMRC